MTTYLINHLRIPGGVPKEESLAYPEQAEATTAPYGGKWLAMDAEVQVSKEHGDMAKAKEWYNLPEYQKILPLRTNHTVSDLILVDGAGPDFTVAGYAQQIRAAIAAATDNGS